MLKILSILSIIFISFSKPLDPNKVVLALNCGSQTQSVDGADKNYKYLPDQQYVGGGKSIDVDYHSDATANALSEIKFSFEKQLYMFERHTYNQMVYSLPVRQGKHTLILKFAQMYFSNEGKRVFDVKIGSKIVVQNLDVVKLTGGRFAAHEQYIEFQVKKDGVYVDNSRVQQGLQAGKLRLSFKKGKADNPIVQGIIVYNDQKSQSTFAEYETMRKNWDKQIQVRKAKKQEKFLQQLIAIQKKKEKTVIRNDQLFAEQDQSKNQVDNTPRQKFGIIRKVLMGPMGMIFWTAAILYNLFYLRNRIFKLKDEPKQQNSLKEK